MDLGTLFLSSAVKRLANAKALGDGTFVQLSDKDFHYQPNESSNSIALIIQHMAGNMTSRWTNFLTEDGEKDWRRRDEEFEPQAQGRSALLDLWEKGWALTLDTIKNLEPGDLQRTVYIRAEALSVLDAINRQLFHYSYHVGQIVYLGKVLRDQQWSSLSIPKRKAEP